MQPRLHLITLAVENRERSLRFYRDGLGLPTYGVMGSEFTADDNNPDGSIVMFHLNGLGRYAAAGGELTDLHGRSRDLPVPGNLTVPVAIKRSTTQQAITSPRVVARRPRPSIPAARQCPAGGRS